MIYLDSSALLKLLYEEPESAALEAWLTARANTPVVSSELTKVEAVRACRRIDVAVLPAARTLLSELDLIPLSGGVIDQASDVGGDLLRSLDAIHLASALAIQTDISTLVSYDHRLLDAATTAGLHCVRPGTPLQPRRRP